MKIISKYDTESLKIFDCYVYKTWFKKTIILRYYKNREFSVEILRKTWFNTTSNIYTNLNWLDSISLMRELKNGK